MRASDKSLWTKITVVSKIHGQSVPVRCMGKMPQIINQWLNSAKLLSEKIPAILTTVEDATVNSDKSLLLIIVKR